jgi:hypothetical protein
MKSTLISSRNKVNIYFIRQSHEERRIQYDLFMHPYHRNEYGFSNLNSTIGGF